MMIRTIDDAFSFLGTPKEQTALLSIDDPYFQQATWHCGCIISYVQEHVGAFDWTACADHQAPEAEFCGRTNAPLRLQKRRDRLADVQGDKLIEPLAG